jgi:hypothetical protein
MFLLIHTNLYSVYDSTAAVLLGKSHNADTYTLCNLKVVEKPDEILTISRVQRWCGIAQ